MHNHTIENREVVDFIRNSIILNQFIKITKLSGKTGYIIPLKGVSLLFTVYSNDYSRNVGDIDFLIPGQDVKELIETLEEKGYLLRSKRATSLRLKAKRKFDMVHRDSRFCDLDIHTDLITKKFFRLTTGDFTSFALTRLRTITHQDTTVSLLSPVDEWLYLAQHYCFHLFSEDKWLKDLYLIQKQFSDEDVVNLQKVADSFGFNRIVTAVSHRLNMKYEDDDVKIPFTLKRIPFFFNFLLKKSNAVYERKLTDRIIASYWEFLFIDKASARLRAYLKLLFPARALLGTIYTAYSPVLFVILYPFHLIITLLSSLLFIPLLLFKIFMDKEQ
jgi:hypothetical protein